ncbi:hypothetical protein FQJ98_09670 [Xanthomonas vasicola]|nr:hypothetical protein FQK00_00085 [Xanthomonas vasicola]TWQ45867.1 hypothetical protein FQJ98_09670 [Xanthomonas vasicola]TWQ76076.1 hypothetical protein FQJ86_00085 [Xanthomonas vasicola]TWR09988.1 hypothetical protein FQJ84_09180 [Xanthomonas vasicola]
MRLTIAIWRAGCSVRHAWRTSGIRTRRCRHHQCVATWRPRKVVKRGVDARCLARFAGCWLRVLGVQRSKEKPRRSGVFRQTTQAATIRTCS